MLIMKIQFIHLWTNNSVPSTSKMNKPPKAFAKRQKQTDKRIHDFGTKLTFIVSDLDLN